MSKKQRIENSRIESIEKSRVWRSNDLFEEVEEDLLSPIYESLTDKSLTDNIAENMAGIETDNAHDSEWMEVFGGAITDSFQSIDPPIGE